MLSLANTEKMTMGTTRQFNMLSAADSTSGARSVAMEATEFSNERRNDERPTQLNAGPVIGITAAAVLFIIIVVFIIVYIMKRRRIRQGKPTPEDIALEEGLQ
jgi:flagellar biosynthesis/type III secretory pathway M-ring protein FliF/YscJ